LKCPKCNTENLETLKFCGECGTQLVSAESNAIEHYEKFLDLWKDADPEFSEVKKARERLTSLSK